MNKEIRNSTIVGLAENRRVEGYAVVFNSSSKDLGGFYETIEPTALDGVLERSDILCLLNHNEDRGILARSKMGEGTLNLEIDDIGLRYWFDAPNTALGDELLEGLRRGDITTSSFAFTIAEDKWEKRSDGSYNRTIKRFKELFDVSPVYKEAYPDTSVALRKIKEFDSIEVYASKKEKIESRYNTIVENSTKLEIQDILEQIEKQIENEDDVDLRNLLTTQQTDLQARLEKLTTKSIKTERKMNNFKLIKAINDVVNNRAFDENATEVIAQGAAEMRKSGLNYSGQIQIPVETRAGEVAVSTTNGVTVATEKLDILEPLRNKMVLSQAGATYMTGLVGNVSIPTYSGSNVGWKGEVDTADKGNGTFDDVDLSPKRLTAYIDISKQFLNQDSVSAEAMLQNDIISALAEKLEATILGDEAGTTDKPAGLFHNATALEIDYKNIVKQEQSLEEENITGNYTYIVSPEIKADLKTTEKASGTGLFLMNGNEVNGYNVLCTNAAKGIVLGKFSEYLIAQWGAIDLTIDPYTQAANGCIRLVINAYFDAKPRRANAFVANTKAA